MAIGHSPENKEKMIMMPSIAERVRRSAKQLEPLLNRRLKEKLPAALEKALKLAEKLEDIELETSVAKAWEKSTLLLSIMASVEDGDIGVEEAKLVIGNIYRFSGGKELAKIKENRKPRYGAYLAIRQLLIESGIKVSDIPEDLVHSIRKNSSSPQEVINGIAKESTYATLRKMIKDPQYHEGGNPDKVLIRLPIKSRTALRAMQAGYTSMEEVRDLFFGGVSIKLPMLDGSSKVVLVVMADSSELTVTHERNHRDFPGLALGGLRQTLNEAVTDILAEEEVGKISERSYILEKELVRWLGSECLLLLKRRYKTENLQNARDLAVKLINEFGFSGYVRLNQASPKHRQTDEHLKAVGRVKTADVMAQLKNKQTLLKTFRRILKS